MDFASDFAKIREKLISLGDPEYAEFIRRGAVTDYPILGVRIPQITEIASEVSRGNSREFLAEFEPKSREEMHLFSMVLCSEICGRFKGRDFDSEAIISEFKPLILKHISRMDSWEFTDIFMSRLKCVKKDRERWLSFIDELLLMDEFYARVGLTLLLGYFVEPEWVQVVFERILRVLSREEYYVKMAVAWLLQKCFSKFPDLTFAFMGSSEIPEWMLRKAVLKIQDSYQVESEWKERAKELTKH